MDGPAGGPRVLIIDDDEDIRSLLTAELEDAGCRTRAASDGETGLESFRLHRPDLLILDLRLPGKSGLDVLRKVRQIDQTPVIILSAKGDEEDRVVGLELGADDYVVKPFYPRELVARIRSVLRRSRGNDAASTILDFGALVVDTAAREVLLDGRVIDTTAKEFDLLAYLASSPRRVCSREEVLREVWGSSSDWQDESTVNEHIHRLRRKIEAEPSTPRWILTSRGVGYRFEP